MCPRHDNKFHFIYKLQQHRTVYSSRWKIRVIHFTDHFCCSVQWPIWVCDGLSSASADLFCSARLFIIVFAYREFFYCRSTADTNFCWNNRLKPVLLLCVREKSEKLHAGRTRRLAFWTAHGSESLGGSPVLVGGAADQPYNPQQSSGFANGTWYWLHSLPEWIQ